ncbi:MAG: SCO family protein [Alphaproteobacteria bacterium]|nr:SCO family protein [Alphaproteobacteria bacterium]
MPCKPNALTQFFTKQKWTILSLLIVLAMYTLVMFTQEANQYAQRNAPNKQAEGIGQAAIGGAFNLQDHHGNPFTEKNLLGKYSLVFFGYTYCPDICPNTLSVVAEVYEELPQIIRQQLQVVFVTVDPERDTVQSLSEYMPAFHDDFIGLTGTQEATQQIADAYKVFFAKRGEGEDYLVDHSGWMYLMSPTGTYLQHHSHNITPKKLAEVLNEALNK